MLVLIKLCFLCTTLLLVNFPPPISSRVTSKSFDHVFNTSSSKDVVLEISDKNLLKEPETNIQPDVLIYFVKNSNFTAWRKSLGPDAVFRRKGPVIYMHRRLRRQTGGTGTTSPNPPKIVTPVLPITGSLGFNETDCEPWEDVAILLRDGMHPKHKSTYIEPRACKMSQGLECLPFEERASTGTNIRYRCQCMLVYGPKALYKNYTDPTGRVKQSCFVPAGLGWASECFAKAWNDYGYPLPFGDPSGTNAEPAIQVDAYNREDGGEQVIIEYVMWNSITPLCVPFSKCRERGTYQGQRCQCEKGHALEKPSGKCGGCTNLEAVGILVVVLLALSCNFNYFY